MNDMVRPFVILALLSVLGCVDPEVSGPVLGDWGGEHLGLIAGVEGAALEFDCATGEITEAIVPDGAGKFSAAGFHTPGHGGPVRDDEVPVRIPAHFTGTVRGSLMTIEVTLPAWAMTIGPFTLLRGASPRVFKCL